MRINRFKQNTGRRLKIREGLSAALTFLIVLIGVAGVVTPANAATIPSSKVVVTFENVNNPSGPTEAWDEFKYTVNLNNLDGLAAGDTTVVKLDDSRFYGMQDTTLYLNADGSSSDDLQANTVARMDINGAAVTMTFTLTDYASSHSNVHAQAYVMAQINGDLTRGDTLPVTVTINGTPTQIGDIDIAECDTDCPGLPDWPAKWGHDNGNGTGSVTIQTPVFADATNVRVVDTLETNNQSIAGVQGQAAYNCVNTWGEPGVLQPDNSCDTNDSITATVTENAVGDYTLSSSVPNVFFSLDLNMAFTGSGPWTDTARVTNNASDSDESAGTTVYKYSAGGGGSGEVSTTPVAPVVNPAECTVDTQGETVWETVTKPANGNGISYGDVVVSDAHVATIVATPAAGFVLDAGALGAGWAANDDGTATWTYQLKSTPKVCADANVVKPETPGLANTGGSLPWIGAGMAGLLLVAGATLFLARRKHVEQ